VSATSRRAARREEEAARVLGTVRVRYRPRHVSAPDALPQRLPDGTVLQVEIKSTKRPPKRILDALDQARRYTPDAVPIAVIAPFGGGAIACLPLVDLARLVGLRAPEVGEQLALLGESR
jgi:hypothetical protein